jgi:hypothetical protein
MTRLIALLIVMTTTGCNKSEPESAKAIFEQRLHVLGAEFEIDENGLYAIKLEGNSLTVNLENVGKDYARDGDSDSVRRFADQVIENFNQPTQNWDSIQPHVRFQLESDDYANGFEGVLHNRVGDGLVKVFVYVSEDQGRITWISDHTVSDWGVSADQIFATAERNMRTIVSQAKIEIQEGNGVTLGMISTEETLFKASLLLADNFRELVEPGLGFPVYAVAPCRDFVFLVPRSSRGALGRLGGVVANEFNNSGHSITMDVLEVTDEGLFAIGTFAQPSTDLGGADQPATAPESSSDGNENPKPKSEGSSR